MDEHIDNLDANERVIHRLRRRSSYFANSFPDDIRVFDTPSWQEE